MTWTATPRYGIGTAPGGLAFVQDFLNTASSGRPRQSDLLSDSALATEWLQGALLAWQAQWGSSPAPEVHIEDLKPRDLTMLRRLRARLLENMRSAHEADRHNDASGPADELLAIEQRQVKFEAGILPDGTVYFLSASTGWKRLLGPLLLEVRRAQDAATWGRLKSCKNDRCRGVFYDRSRNNSGVWHDVRTCGNAANLRASRERHRAVAGHQHAGEGARS